MKFRAIKAIFIKDVKQLLRDKIALFWIVIFPMFMIGISYMIWANPTPPITLDVGVVYADSTLSDYQLNATLIVYTMNQTEIDGKHLFNVKVLDSNETAIDMLREGDLDAVIVFSEGFSKNMTFGFPSKLFVYVSSGDAYKEQTTKAIIMTFLSEWSRKLGEKRVECSLEYVTEYIPEEAKEQMQYIVWWMKGLVTPLDFNVSEVSPKLVFSKADMMGIFILGMTGTEILICGVIAGATAIIEEKERKTIKRIMASPVSPWDLLTGKTLSALFSLALSTLACFVSGYALGGRIRFNALNLAHWLLIPMFVMAGLMTIGIGLIISLIAKSTKGAEGLAMAISWPLMFLTGMWIPKWMLPPQLRIISDIFPLSRLLEATRAVIIFGKGAEILIAELPILAISTLITYGAGIIAYKRLYKIPE